MTRPEPHAQPSVVKLRSLVALGHSPRMLTERSRNWLDIPLLLAWQGPQLAGWVVDAIDRLFDELAGVQGTDAQIAAQARAMGWPIPSRLPGRCLPGADGIESEDQEPAGDLPSTPDEQLDRIRELTVNGMTDKKIGEVLGISENSVRYLRRKHRIPARKAAATDAAT